MTIAYFVVGAFVAVAVCILGVRFMLRKDVFGKESNVELVLPISFAVFGSIAIVPLWPILAVPAAAWLALRWLRREPRAGEQP